MSRIVYALLEGAAADAADEDLRRSGSAGAANPAQLHRRAPLDANILPDGATEYGRNLLIAMAAGAVIMAATGAIAGALDLMLGMGVAMGTALGLVTGTLMGLVGAMQAGTRVAKAPLRSLEPSITDGRALLIIEVSTRADAARVADIMKRHGPAEVGILGGW